MRGCCSPSPTSSINLKYLERCRRRQGRCHSILS
jgi:hypothetical protein